MPNKVSKFIELAIMIARLPVARLEFRLQHNPADVEHMHRYYTMPHPRYKVFANKALGAALVDLARYRNREEYIDSIIQGRNSAGYFARRARSRGYRVVEIDRNEHIDEIHEINTSLPERQGRPMAQIYLDKVTHFPRDRNYTYYGVLNAGGKLVAYADLGLYGNFFALNRLLGLRNNDGLMHLLVSEIICQRIELGTCRYLMYDTYFGASAGLQVFKKMLGFEPYRAKYSIQ